MEEAIRAMANLKAVGPDGLPVERLEISTDEEESNTLGKPHEGESGTVQNSTRSSLLCGGEVTCNATTKILHKKKISGKERPLWWRLFCGSRRQSTPHNHRAGRLSNYVERENISLQTKGEGKLSFTVTAAGQV